MRIKYTGFPMEPRHPAFKNEPTNWMPIVQVRIAKQHQWTPRFGAVLDSGSPWCIFPSAMADFLGIRVTDGVESVIGGILKGGLEAIYFHKVKIQVANNWNISATVGFTKKLSVSGILGRNGFFDNFVVRFDHTDKPPCLEIEKIEKVQ